LPFVFVEAKPLPTPPACVFPTPSNRRLFAPGPPASLIRSCDDRVHLLLIVNEKDSRLEASTIDHLVILHMGTLETWLKL